MNPWVSTGPRWGDATTTSAESAEDPALPGMMSPEEVSLLGWGTNITIT